MGLAGKIYTKTNRILLWIAYAGIMAFGHFGVDTIFIKVAQREEIGTRYVQANALYT